MDEDAMVPLDDLFMCRSCMNGEGEMCHEPRCICCRHRVDMVEAARKDHAQCDGRTYALDADTARLGPGKPTGRCATCAALARYDAVREER